MTRKILFATLCMSFLGAASLSTQPASQPAKQKDAGYVIAKLMRDYQEKTSNINKDKNITSVKSAADLVSAKNDFNTALAQNPVLIYGTVFDVTFKPNSVPMAVGSPPTLRGPGRGSRARAGAQGRGGGGITVKPSTMSISFYAIYIKVPDPDFPDIVFLNTNSELQVLSSEVDASKVRKNDVVTIQTTLHYGSGKTDMGTNASNYTTPVVGFGSGQPANAFAVATGSGTGGIYSIEKKAIITINGTKYQIAY